jgi:hypothetical protein
MRSITRLSPRDPADEMSRHIGTKVAEKLISVRLREIEQLVEAKVALKREALNGSR